MEQTYEGYPRKEIKWFPTIDLDKCTQCGTCVKFCHQEVYESIDGKTVIARPYSCVVGCTGCQSQCPEEAISFPSMRDLRDMLRALRAKYGPPKR